MPIRPIDLQTLLMQLNQVGREQSAGKEGTVLEAAIQGATAQRKQGENKEEVRKTEDPKNGAGAVRDRSGGAGGGAAGGKRKQDEADSGESEPGGEEVVKDPDLGNRVDLSG